MPPLSQQKQERDLWLGLQAPQFVQHVCMLALPYPGHLHQDLIGCQDSWRNFLLISYLLSSSQQLAIQSSLGKKEPNPQLYITHRYNCYKSKSYHLPDLSNNTQNPCNPLIPPCVFQSYSGTCIQNNSVVWRAVQANHQTQPNTEYLWCAGRLQFRDILPIPEKLTSSSLSWDETPGAWGFKGDFSGECPETLTKHQVLL